MSYYVFDSTTPITSDAYSAAVLAVDCALTATDLLIKDYPNTRVTVALSRPPGHHAHRDQCGGYCYLNNIAVAAQHILDTFNFTEAQKPRRIAILDIDYHHGNGTQDIFYDTSEVFYVSIHCSPDQAYPYFSGREEERGVGKGEGFNLNIPLPSNSDDVIWFSALEQSIGAIKKYGACMLLLSLGFDTFEEDPICSFKVSEQTYFRAASLIATLDVPTLIVLEGGYCIEKLGDLLIKFLKPWNY